MRVDSTLLEDTYNYHFTEHEEELKGKLATGLNQDKKFRLLREN